MSNDQPLDVQVLVVGAGPTGLAAACLLQALGVSALVVDTRSGTTTRSKALVVQARTLELFEKLGLAAAALQQGEPLRKATPIVRGKPRGTVDISVLGQGETRYPYLLSLEQSRTEEILHTALRERGGSVRWNTTLQSFQEDAAGVTATLLPAADNTAAPGTPTRVRCQWVLAADGAHSTVRHALGITLEGGTYQHAFVLADVAAPDLPPQTLSMFLSWHGFAAFFPMKGSTRARAISMLRGPVPADNELPFAEVAASIQHSAGQPVRMEDPRWCSVYRLHHRAAARLRQGRAFLLGDAAHIHSPAGGQGMNTGIQDAFNLCWKLAAVLNHGANPALLDTYHTERHPVALSLLRGTDRVFSLASSSALPARALRAWVLPYALPLVFRSRFFRHRVFRRVSQIAVRYRESPLSHDARGVPTSRAAKPCAGSRMPWVDTPAGLALSEAQKGLHGLVVVFQPTEIGSGALSPAQEQADLRAALESALQPWSAWVRLHVVPQSPDTAEVFRACRVGTEGAVLFVRPDGYIGFVGTAAQRDSLRAYLQSWFTTPVRHPA